MNEINDFIALREFLCPFCSVGTQQEGYESGSGLSPSQAGILIWDYQPPEL